MTSFLVRRRTLGETRPERKGPRLRWIAFHQQLGVGGGLRWLGWAEKRSGETEGIFLLSFADRGKLKENIVQLLIDGFHLGREGKE